MKRLTKILLSVGAILCSLGVVLLVSLLLLSGGDFSKMATVRYEEAQTVIEQEFSDISLEASSEQVRILPSTDGVCRVDYMQAENLSYDIGVSDGVLKITERDTRKWYQNIGIYFGNRELNVYLPQEAYGDLNVSVESASVEIKEGFTFASVDLQGQSGWIAVRGLTANALTVRLQSGGADVQNLQIADSLSITAESGGVDIENVVCGSLSVKTQSGGVEMKDAVCESLSAETQSGAIGLQNVCSNGGAELRAQSGSIKLKGCDAASYFIRADSGSVRGSILTNKIFAAKTDYGNVDVPVSTEGGVCEVVTSSGDIHLWIGTGD